MFNWLIVMLGGFTDRDKSALDQVTDGWRTRALAAETTVELVKDILQRERDRSDRIENEIRERMYPRQDQQQAPPDMRPLGNTISSWPRIKRELERQHRMSENAPTKEEVQNAQGSGT